MSRLRDIQRRQRGDLHREMSVSAIYLAAPSATPIPCNVRVWLKTDEMLDVVPGVGEANPVTTEDRLRFDLGEISTVRRNALVSIDAGEGYRLDFLYPADLGYQTARVLRLSASEAAALAAAVETP